jgi:PAS domain S-box-containing protein
MRHEVNLDFLKCVEAHIEYFKNYLVSKNNPTKQSSEEGEAFDERLKDILDYIDVLRMLIFESNSNIFVVDRYGNTIIVNKAFEQATGISAEEVIGMNVIDMERIGLVRPSIMRLVLKEKRSISIIQRTANGKDLLVNALPVFDENGEIIIAFSNSIPIDKIRDLSKYVLSKVAPKVYHSHFYVSENPLMKNVFMLIEQIKDTDATILITGETGVGKGVIARYIHEKSNRKNKKMVEINCGAIPENLIESELFGYESGAFTGANKVGKSGLIEEADGGTLMLDEISALPLSLQVKLLNVLQDKKIVRIGGNKTINVDMRIIAISNQNLHEMVQKGTFRADLYYRLNVISIYIPTLRERKDDIYHAAQFYISKYNKKYAKSIFFSEGFLNSITNYNWYGNMRELENYIERKILTNSSGFLASDDTLDIAGKELLSSETGFKSDANISESDQLILDLYNTYHSSYKVAKVLGISQSTAFRKIKHAISNQA